MTPMFFIPGVKKAGKTRQPRTEQKSDLVFSVIGVTTKNEKQSNYANKISVSLSAFDKLKLADHSLIHAVSGNDVFLYVVPNDKGEFFKARKAKEGSVNPLKGRKASAGILTDHLEAQNFIEATRSVGYTKSFSLEAVADAPKEINDLVKAYNAQVEEANKSLAADKQFPTAEPVSDDLNYEIFAAFKLVPTDTDESDVQGSEGEESEESETDDESTEDSEAKVESTEQTTTEQPVAEAQATNEDW